MTPIAKANELLTKLASHSGLTSLYSAICSAYSADDVTKITTTYNKWMTKNASGTVCYGCIPGSTKTIVQQLMPDLLPSEVASVIDVLKDNKKVFQIGGGKGKILVVVDTAHVIDTEADLSNQLVNKDDLVSLLKALNEAVSNHVSDAEVLKGKVKELEESIAAKQEKIEQLERDLRIRFQSTWS